jgi:hypothetical protein
MPDEADGIVTRYAKLWPREVFYIKHGKYLDMVKDQLDVPGVYVLYRGVDVFYVGQANSLFDRLRIQARKRYRLWDHFSAFVVPEHHLNDVEAIVIAATPRTANRSGGKRIGRISLPSEVEQLLLKCREIDPDNPQRSP